MSAILHHKISGESIDKINSSEKITSTRDDICKVIRCIGYVTCLSLAMVNSWAIFRSYTSDIKIKSTKVVPSPGNYLDSPLILLCNSSAYKDQILPTTKESYIENTMKLSEVLVDALVVRDVRKGPLSFRPKSIKEKVKEVETMFQGTCITIKGGIQVKQISGA